MDFDDQFLDELDTRYDDSVFEFPLFPYDTVVPDDEGLLFHVPPRKPWKKFCEELELEKNYVPEDNTPLIFRKVR